MAIKALKDVYIDQLQDLYSACEQAHGVVQELADAAKNSSLKDALTAGVGGIKDGKDTMAEIVKAHGQDPTAEHCKGMEGLVAEARAHGLEEDFEDADAQDAMIITQYQRMAHYAIAGYGCCRQFAERLGFEEDASKIARCLDASYDGDRTMTEIATNGVNASAAA